MRRRILRISLGSTLALIAVMTGLMLWGDWVVTTGSYQRQLDADLDAVAVLLHERYHANAGELTREQVEAACPSGRRLEVELVDGDVITVGDPAGDGPSATLVVEDMGTLSLEDTTGSLHRARLVASGTILAAGLLLALVAVVVNVRMSRRLTEPFDDLLAHAERLETGDLRVLDHDYGIEEFDRLVDAMNATVARLSELLGEERRMTIDASHQLKTPLTALSLRLEELSELRDDPEVRSEVLLALEQVERLSAVVDDLLVERRSPDARRTLVALSEVVDQQLAEWQHVFTASGRSLQTVIELTAPCLVDPGPVGQVIATLLENSLQHGAGTTTIAVREPSGAAWVEVYDEGQGVPDEIAAKVFERAVSGAGGTGLGLAAAQDAAVSVGGRLALVRRRPAHFRLFLNLREHPPAVRPEAEESAEGEPDHVGGDVVGQG